MISNSNQNNECHLHLKTETVPAKKNAEFVSFRAGLLQWKGMRVRGHSPHYFDL